ncbi:DHA1 family bicyclomycin/chloramphenicol resistance-like MFS transporter [Virgibacillus natechei]|uniref:Bcr/CflA family efflux transporter n=1 Tax=Virgibacillus natechei TaxID=1216297 RepID=A0ABS4IGE9_9BACI|nr:Bcr/CflA family efflux MFS transporter [Virgibacillus natechei]MBP1969938.1 DHA1 family bicyclomycin/chloramphenicol resistance-like MFS transporter [Virgibacillus natechei]UZD13398.1 Bcr/CflA family efflux MFS transporter [Virgibacillus natechei]
MLHNPTGKTRVGLALLLGLLAFLGPLNIDMYLPSFPGIAQDFGINATLVQFSLTACLIGLAIGQVVIGPISDSQGRRKPLLIATTLFVLASILCALAPNITTLIAARFLQGFTASAGVVLSRAVVRDVFTGKQLTKFFALLMVINAVAPMVAPMLGGAILAFPSASWQTIFYFLAFIGVLIVIIVAVKLKETLPPEKRIPSSIGSSVMTMGSLLKDRSFIGYALVVGFVHGGSFAYVSGTPFVYQDIYGVSPQVFSVLFGINGIAIITGSFIIGRLSGIVSELKMLQAAVTTALAATTLLLVMTFIEGPLASLVILIFIYMITMGMIITSTFTLGMAKQGHRAGSASAVLGMLPMLLGAASSPLAGINESSAVPMGAILFTTSLIGFIAFFTLVKTNENES